MGYNKIQQELNRLSIGEMCILSGVEMDKEESSVESKECCTRSELVSEDGKNLKSVLCQRCGSKVLCPGMAVYSEKEVLLSHCNIQHVITWSEIVLMFNALYQQPLPNQRTVHFCPHNTMHPPSIKCIFFSLLGMNSCLFYLV